VPVGTRGVTEGMPLINRLAIIGTGLIGGSFALALKQAGEVGTVVGTGRSQENLGTAKQLGIVDEVASDPGQAVKGADLVFLAVPVGQMAEVMKAIAPHLDPAAAITDAGSTKQDVCAMGREHLSAHLSWFVPGHPIAGAETSGAQAAHADLYREKNVVLTPLAETNFKAIVKVQSAWQHCGAKATIMPSAKHDRIFAAVSHLPHLLAYALVDMLAGRPDHDLFFHYAASGFRDFTRIAGSNPEMWRDIAIANREAVLAELEAYEAKLQELKTSLKDSDAQALFDLFSRAQGARSSWSKQGT
jgi:prephenate dehydrogenase